MRSNEYFEAVKSHLEKEGYAEEITEANFVVPQESDYVDFGEEAEEWDIAADRPGLWENIRRKKQREGDNYKPAKPGDPDRPTPDQLKRAQGPCKCSDDSTEALQYGKPPKNDPRKSKAEAYGLPKEVVERELKKNKAKMSQKQKEALDKNKDGKVTKEDFELLRKDKKSDASEYQGRKVSLNKPFRTPDGPKKMSVYVKNEKGNVVKVNFGDPNMEIKRDNPARRKSFRARHNCSNPGPKWKARYWSCKAW